MTSTASSHPFEALRARLLGDAVPTPSNAPPPIARLFRALDTNAASPLDLAALLRHVLQREGGALRVSAGSDTPTAADWASVGIAATPVDGAFSIESLPWKPEWLPNVPDEGVDGAAAQSRERRRSDLAAADPYLTAFGYDSYRSPGQRRALRAALSAPRGSTLVVSLPTGEGKSLAFQALARVGFGDGPGVTLVVTPTVALAADHEQSSHRLGFDDTPLAYRAGEAERNQPLLDRIRSGDQSLCFASPEAVCTSLSEPLREAARRGRLRTIVVDEAHLIDTWGINFRPEFQMLAGLRRQLLELAGERRFRTVLLSATLTHDSIDVLRTIFPGDPFRVVSAARLRPEIGFWVADTTDEATREARVFEALLHLPRPLILYTTTRADAAHWYEAVRERGFRRVGTITGDTPDAARSQVVRDWRDGEIDLVVGTSAFGLGIDNPDVRAVVHACVPESLDRFYQEVGRGGRDGRASVSLLLPSHRDLDIAAKISGQQMLTGELAAHRWRAMFTHEDHQYEEGVHTVPVDCRPGVDDREIDMVGPMNTGWNVKTLVLMAAAGGIRLLDVPDRLVRQLNSALDFEDDDDDEGASDVERPRVSLIIDTSIDQSFWEDRIAMFRAARKGVARRSFERMKSFLVWGDRCAAEAIAPMYEIEGDVAQDLPDVRVGRACGGCPPCRRTGRLMRDSNAPATPHPWPPPELTGPLPHLLNRNGQLLVFHGQRASGPLARRREKEALRRISACGIRNLVLLGDAFDADDFAEIGDTPLFVAHELGLNDLPEGPTVIVARASERLPAYQFAAREPGGERIWLLDESVPHPSKPGVTLLQAPPVARVLGLAEFISELQR